MVSRVGVPEIRVVVKERVPLDQKWMQIGHRFREELHSDHVHRQALRRGEQPVVAGDQRAGEVAGHVQHRGAAGAQERVLHLADDRVEPVGDHRERDGVEAHAIAFSRTGRPSAASDSSSSR